MCKRFLALMLAFVMVVALLPTAVFAASGDVTEPVADEAASDGSPSSGDTQPPEEPIEEEEPDGSDMGIATIALDESNETLMKEYFKDFQGEYALPDGSGWKVIIDSEGKLSMSSVDEKANNAYVDSITYSGTTVRTIRFTSPDWYNSSQKPNNTLTLTWTTQVNSLDHKAFKCTATTLYNDDKSVIKGFTTNCYFIASDGIFSYDYFKNGSEVSKGGSSYAYVGDYVLSDAYNTVYGGDIDGIGSWKIEVADNGHVYLYEGKEEKDKYEAVMTSGKKTNGIDRVNQMVAALPGWYTNNTCTTPAYMTLTWGCDEESKSSNYGNGALYFETTGLTVYKPNEEGETGSQNAISAHIPAMRFELSEGGESKIAKFAKSKLAPFATTTDTDTRYRVNDGTEEYIEIKTDGSVVLHIGEDKELTPLYYTVNNAAWLAEDPESSRMPPEVTSVVFSSQDWYAQKDPKTSDRPTLTLNWDEANRQFAVASDTTCCAADGTLSRLYTTATKYQQQDAIDEGLAYMYQYVKGTYTLNDGSKWTIEVKQDSADEQWKVYTKFGTEGYTEVDNPAPVFVQDTTYTGENGKEEFGNKGKYLTTITVPVPGWYLDEGCTQAAVVTLNWNGQVYNPMDNHQFTVTDTAIYRENGGKTECKYLVGTFYSDADRQAGEEFLKSIGVAGTYRPTAAEGKWWIEIDDDGKVTVHATDFKGTDHPITDIAMDLTMDKSIKNHNNPNFGQINGVTDIKVVIPEWRTVGTNDTLANIAQCGEVTFTFVQDPTYVASSYFTPSKTYIYADTNESGDPWTVVEKSGRDGYNKVLITKIYDNDRAYSDANREKAKEYFKQYPGTYYIEDASLDYKLTVTEEGEIYWDVPGGDSLPADVAFDAIKDEDGDGKVSEGETEPVPGTISVWLNGYTTGKYSSSTKNPHYNDGTQRADLTWNDTDEKDIVHSAHKFKTSGNSTPKGYKGGAGSQISFDLNKYYTLGEEVTAENFVPAGTYKTANDEFRIEVVTKGDETTYTFYRPDTPDMNYPLKLFGSGDAAYLRGYIGMMKKVDVYILVTKGPYDGFLLTGYEVTYNNIGGRQNNSSSGEQVTIPAGTRFTNYELGDTGTDKNIIVVEEGQTKEQGTRYSRLSLALHSLKGGETIYLEDDIKVGFMAILPDNVGNVTIDGQGHKITRDTVVNPNTILMDPEIGENDPIMSILMNPGISLMALNDGSEESVGEHYTGSILQIGSGNKVTLKDLTIDGEGKWEIDKDKLEYDKKLNEDYDINILDDPSGGHPIKELDGNVVSTDSLIKVIGGKLILDGVTLENFFAGDGYDDDRHFIDFMSTEDGELEIKSETVFKHNASRSGVCIGNTDKNKIYLNGYYDEYKNKDGHPEKENIRPNDYTVMEDNYCYGGNGGLIVAMEGTQVYMEDGTRIINNVAADTNGVFIQLHKKTDGVKDGDNKGEIYSKFYMNGGEISDNIGLRGGSYGWGQTVYLYNGGSFIMNGGKICNNIGAGISTIYQQPSADALTLNAGEISGNTCSLRDEGTDWALDIALMNIGDIGEGMVVKQNFVVGAAAILGGYASGDEYLTNNGLIKGNISVYSYFNNEGHVTTVENNNIIDGDIRLENGSSVINNAGAEITGDVTVRGSLSESAGESSFHNEGRIMGDVILAEGAHLYNNGEIFGDVTVKAGATLEMDSMNNGGDDTGNDKTTNNEKLGGTIHGNVTLYPDSVIYADVSGTYVDGSIYLEYETEEDLARMLGVIEAKGIQCSSIIPKKHEHTIEETVIEPDDQYKCTDPWIKSYACQTCGKVVKTEETEPTGHVMYLYSTDEATCTTGRIDHYRCLNCTAYNSSTTELKVRVGEPLGHNYVENKKIRIPATAYADGHEYYICTRCGDLLEIDIPKTSVSTKHTFQNDDGELILEKGVITIPATCTTDGEMTFTCEDCKVELKLTIPATGHKYPDPSTADPEKDYICFEHRDSTCTTAGYNRYAPICTVCHKNAVENGDNTTSGGKSNLTYQVNLPKLSHEWTEWKDVDVGIDYSCTTERKQERQCEKCKTVEERLGGITGHTFEDGVCTVCGFVKDGHTINYMTNGGVMPDSLSKAAETVYKPGTEVKFWKPTDDKTLTDGWTKQVPGGRAIFVGWSTTNHGTDPVEEDVDDIVTQVTIPESSSPTVFAVWAMDRNKNGTPDYKEGDTTVSIVYDANGGKGDIPETLTGLLPGVAYPIETAPGLTKGSDIFAGWTTNVDLKDNVISNMSDDVVKSLVISPYTVPAETVGTITLYAVYAKDEKDSKGDPIPDGKPDFCEEALHVEYYINGGEVYDGYTVDENDMFYICNDYHMPGDDADLLAVEYGAAMIHREKAVLLGWSAGPCDVVTSKEEEGDRPITVVSLTGAESNAKVYALWAKDENGNHIPDYEEKTLNHTYHRNQFLSQNNKTTLPEGYHLNISIPEPNFVTGILPGMWVELESNTYFGSADAVNDAGDVQDHYVQVGWSAYSHSVCETKKDYNNWVIAGEDDGYTEGDKYYRRIVDERYQDAYAVWAIDNNHNDIADFLEGNYTVTLKLNGGTAGGEDFHETNLVEKGDEFTFPTDPTKAGYKFLGWSTEGDKKLYKEGDTVEVTADVTYIAQYEDITHIVTLDLNGGTGGSDFEKDTTVNDGESFTFPADPTKEGYTFLGWSAEGDENLYKAGDTVTVTADVTYIAQYEPITATLTYDANGGTGDVPADKTCNKGEKVTLESGSGLKRENAVFLGWSLTKHESIIQSQAEENSVTIITEIKSLDADTTVYAVWAIDENGNGTPDYKETEPTPGDTAKLHYDANGGTGNVPADKTYGKGMKVTLASGEGLKRENAVFLGWSLTKHESIIQSQAEEDSVTIITEIKSLDADTTVYAVWAIDEKGGSGKNPDPNKPVEPGTNPSNPNDVPDYKQATLTYDANGGTGDVPADKTYNKGEKVTLESGSGLKRENAVFLGWSLEKHEGIIQSQAEENSVTIITEIKSLDADTTVYAVWAIDEKGGSGKNPDPNKPVEPGTNPSNPNDVPDYKQATLTYDANGGTGNVPADKTYNKGEKVTLESGSNLKRENAVFLGWSLTKHEGIIQSQAEENSVTIITEIKSLDADTTVYAVWAVDENGNGTPDYKETEPTPGDTVKLHYDANGGTGNVPADKTCNKGEKVTLESGSGLKRENAVFLGWSLTKHEGIIQSQAEEDSVTIITEIKSLDADTTVYAVWAIDEKGGSGKNPDPNKPVEPGTNPSNPNDVPDYKQATLTYDANGGTGDVPADKTYNKGEKVTLESGSNLKRENAVFLGWSLTKHGIIQSQAEEDSVTIITEIKSLDADTTVYAVWAVDKNGNSTPDYKETEPTPSDTVKLHYDANGGTGDVPADKTCNKGEKVTLESGSGIKRENAVFLGWSLTKHGIIKTQAEEEAAGIVDTVTVNADTTVYAVWAEDIKGGPDKDDPDPSKPVDPGTNPANPDDIPDYEEVTLTYNVNGGEGDVPRPKVYSKGTTVPLVSGSGLKRENAVFLGWSLEKHESIIQSQAEENSVTIITKIKSLDADTTVYAVWAVDENGNGIPDYRTPNPDPYTPPSTLNTEDHFAYIVGYGTDYVRPDGDITRAEVATILFRLLKDETREKYMATENIFPDVKDTDWFAVAVNTMANMGIVFGDGSGFRPNDPITRAEMAAMVSRFFEYSADTAFEGKYSDVKEDDWFAGFVHMVSRVGIMQGTGDGTFSPLEHLTRAQAMAVINRLLGRKLDKRGFLEGMLTWADNADENAWYYADVQEATNSHNCEEVTENGVNYERWTELTENREWTAFEHGIGT